MLSEYELDRMYGAYLDSTEVAEYEQGSPPAAISASTHAAVLAPAGREATHLPPPAAQVVPQLWPFAPSCQEMPLLPHAQSTSGVTMSHGHIRRPEEGEAAHENSYCVSLLNQQDMPPP